MILMNISTGEAWNHYDFVSHVWEQAENNYKNSGNAWCNLTKEEQLELYCEEFEKEVADRKLEILMYAGRKK